VPEPNEVCVYVCVRIHVCLASCQEECRCIENMSQTSLRFSAYRKPPWRACKALGHVTKCITLWSSLMLHSRQLCVAQRGELGGNSCVALGTQALCAVERRRGSDLVANVLWQH